MSDYSVAPHGEFWHVLKDGRFFCVTTSKEMAERIRVSLEGSRTPAVHEFHAGDIEDSKDLKQSDSPL